MIRRLAERLLIMIAAKWVGTQSQSIAGSDVVKYLVEILDILATANDTFEFGGPEVLRYEEMIRRTNSHLKRRPVIIPVPVLTQPTRCIGSTS